MNFNIFMPFIVTEYDPTERYSCRVLLPEGIKINNNENNYFVVSSNNYYPMIYDKI